MSVAARAPKHLLQRFISSAGTAVSLRASARAWTFPAGKRMMSTGKDGPDVSSVSSVGFRLSRSGRFSGETDPLMEQFNASFPYDKRMWRQDLQGSIAYAAALGRCGLLQKEEVESLQNGLRAVEKEWEAGKFEAKPGDEDIHTANERRLTEIVGSVGGKLHTGRSRNDQVSWVSFFVRARVCAWRVCDLYTHGKNVRILTGFWAGGNGRADVAAGRDH
eukprot:3636324-Rhodomonas_salina.2